MCPDVPKASNPAVARTMRKIKGKDTKLEIMVRKPLWRSGYRYRKNNRSLYGTPDISFPSLRIVIFLDSCFWHGCPQHFKLPRSNSEFWKQKIQRNIEHDADVTRHYVEDGWTIIRFWEHEVNEDLEEVLRIVRFHVDNAREARRKKST